MNGALKTLAEQTAEDMGCAPIYHVKIGFYYRPRSGLGNRVVVRLVFASTPFVWYSVHGYIYKGISSIIPQTKRRHRKNSILCVFIIYTT